MRAEVKSTIRDLYLSFQYPKPKKVLFDHLPKCGGITVGRYLLSHYRYNKVFIIDSRDPQTSVRTFKLFPEATRFDYDLVVGHGAHGLLDFVHPETIKMTIFRDPVERIISHYYFVQRDIDNYLHEIVTGKQMTLEEYVTSGISRELRNWYVTHFSGDSIVEAESRPEWSVAKAHRIIKDRYHVIGFLDDLVGTMNILGKEAGYRRHFQNAHLNKTANRPKKNEIDESALDSIKSVNFLDVELYNRLKNELGN
jgi:hypothetical protein